MNHDKHNLGEPKPTIICVRIHSHSIVRCCFHGDGSPWWVCVWGGGVMLLKLTSIIIIFNRILKQYYNARFSLLSQFAIILTMVTMVTMCYGNHVDVPKSLIGIFGKRHTHTYPTCLPIISRTEILRGVKLPHLLGVHIMLEEPWCMRVK